MVWLLSRRQRYFALINGAVFIIARPCAMGPRRRPGYGGNWSAEMGVLFRGEALQLPKDAKVVAVDKTAGTLYQPPGTDRISTWPAAFERREVLACRGGRIAFVSIRLPVRLSCRQKLWYRATSMSGF